MNIHFAWTTMLFVVGMSFSLIAMDNNKKAHDSISLDIPVSVMADELIRSPLNDNLVKQLEDIEKCEPEYQRLLQLELIEKNKVPFSSLDSYNTLEFKDEVTFIGLNQKGKQFAALMSDGGLVFSAEPNKLLDFPSLNSEGCAPLGITWNASGFPVVLYQQKIIEGEIHDQTFSLKKITNLNSNIMCLQMGEYGNAALCEHYANNKKFQKCINLLNSDPLIAEPLYTEIPLVKSFAIDSYGKRALLTDGEEKVYMVNIGKDKKPQVLSLPECINLVKITPDGMYGAMVHKNSIFVVHLESGSVIERISCEEVVTALCFSPCGRYVAYGFVNGNVYVYDRINRERELMIKHNGAVQALAWGRDNSTLRSVGKDKVIATLPLGAIARKLTWKQIALLVKSMQFSSDNAQKLGFFKKVYDELVSSYSKEGEKIMSTNPLFLLNRKGEQCPLCREVAANSITQCKHVFCENCLRKSLEEKYDCPLCRARITNFIAPDRSYTVKYQVNFE
jgi:hypothetical protein